MTPLVLVLAAALGAQMIDRVLAVIGGEPITLSDVTAALRFDLVPAAGASDANKVDAALDALIDRHLQLIEVNRYLPPEPPAAEIDARLDRIRERFPSQEAFDRALTESGISLAQLRARVRDVLRIDIYLRQRFGASYQPSEDEIARYYRAHPSAFMRDGAQRTYEDAREDARKGLLDERAETLVRDWIAGLRRRADVTILPK
jgi:hypothetical protein